MLGRTAEAEAEARRAYATEQSVRTGPVGPEPAAVHRLERGEGERGRRRHRVRVRLARLHQLEELRARPRCRPPASPGRWQW
jgi:hypothetical protein